jgi:hypothetical protein
MVRAEGRERRAVREGGRRRLGSKSDARSVNNVKLCELVRRRILASLGQSRLAPPIEGRSDVRTRCSRYN